MHQQTYITTSIIDNSVLLSESETSEFIYNNILDKIYLPSVEEMTNTSNGYDRDQYEEDIARRKKVTDYAKALGCEVTLKMENYNECKEVIGYFYWLRTPSIDYNDCALYVYANGDITDADSYVSICEGVVPVLKIIK